MVTNNSTLSLSLIESRSFPMLLHLVLSIFPNVFQVSPFLERVPRSAIKKDSTPSLFHIVLKAKRSIQAQSVHCVWRSWMPSSLVDSHLKKVWEAMSKGELPYFRLTMVPVALFIASCGLHSQQNGNSWVTAEGYSETAK